MDDVDGLSLKQVSRTFRGEGRLIPVDMSLEIIIGAAEALGAIHQETPALSPHGQVNPSAIKLLPDGSVDILRPQGEDPNLAQWTPSPDFSMTHGTIESVLSYLSPEQLPEGAQGAGATPPAKGPGASHPGPDHRSDQFALGLIAVELLIGRPVYDAPTLTLMGEQVKAAEVRPALARVEATFPDVFPILDRALRLDPEGRFPTIQGLAEALRPLAAAAVPSDITLGKMIALVKSGEPAPHLCGRSIPWQSNPPPSQLKQGGTFPWQDIDAGLPPEPVALQETGEFQVPEGATPRAKPAAYDFDPDNVDDAITEAMAQGHLLGPDGTLKASDTGEVEQGSDPTPRFNPGNHMGHRSPEALRKQASQRLMRALPQREDDLALDDLDTEAFGEDHGEGDAPQAQGASATRGADYSGDHADDYEDAVTQPFIPLAMAEGLGPEASAKGIAPEEEDPWETAATEQVPAMTPTAQSSEDALGAPAGFFVTGTTGRGEPAQGGALILPKDEGSSRGVWIGIGLAAAMVLAFFLWPSPEAPRETIAASTVASTPETIAASQDTTGSVSVTGVSGLTAPSPKAKNTDQGAPALAPPKSRGESTGPKAGQTSATPDAVAYKPLGKNPPAPAQPEAIPLKKSSVKAVTPPPSPRQPRATSEPVKPLARPKGLENATVRGRIMPGAPPPKEVLAMGGGGAPPPERVEAPKEGTFSLRSFPQATSIYLGDRDLSSAIRRRTPLPTGSHTLLVTVGDGREAKINITIRPDTWHRFVYNFEEQTLDEKGESIGDLSQRP